MPLHEFLKMFRGKLESSQEKAPSPTQISSSPENELVELLWENGQIMMQGQSSRAKKSPMLNDFQSQLPGVQDRFAGNATNRKIEKFGPLGFGVASASVPLALGDMYLNQEDDMVPWLNYPEDDGFKQDFCSEISPDISGVTSNDPSNHNSFLSLGRGSSNQMLPHPPMVQVIDGANLEARNAAKVSSRPGFLNSYLPVQGQISVPPVGSGVSNINTNTTNTRPDAVFGNSVEVQASADDFNSMKIQKPNAALPGSGSNFLNFSHFSRPVALLRANLEKADGLTASCSSGVEKMGNEKVSAANSNTPMKFSHAEPCGNPRKEICCHSQPKLFSSMGNLKPSVVKPLEESYCAKQSDILHQEVLIKSPRQAIGASISREVTKREKPVEHVVAASSVCSGNSGEGASNDQIHDSKRKIRDNDESESRSEDIEEESVGVKKPPHARGCSSSKRSRAAEVHNLSERRRRDRINEKMRALQELIPNCNKADKASMLDEAIEYLKTLQLQVQMMSMGAGFCMPPMMFPTGLQHMHPALMPHFPPMAGGMGMGMGFGMGMLDLNSGSPRFPVYPVPPMQGAHFPSPPISGSSAFQGLAGTNHPIFGHPGQGLPMSVPRAPLVPLMRQAPITSAVGLNAIRMGIPVEPPITSPTFKPDLPLQNEDSQLIRNADTGNTMDQTTDQQQTTIKDFDQSVLGSKDNQVPNAGAADSAVNLTATSDVVSSKGGD